MHIKGQQRRIARGIKGPSQWAVARTIKKANKRAQRKLSGKKLPTAKKEKIKFDAELKRVQTIVVSKALSGAGLTDRGLRKNAHELAQSMVKYYLEYAFPENKEMQREAAKALEGTYNDLLDEIAHSNGREAAQIFNGLMAKQQNMIKLVQSEMEKKRKVGL